MAISAGDLVVTLGMNNDPLMQGFAGSRRQLRKFSSEVRRGAGSSNKLNFALLEMGRLAEDASVGFSLNGLSGAIRASSNNMTQLLTIMGPLAGGIAGLAAAGVTMLLPMFQQAKEDARELRDELAEFRKDVDDMLDRRQGERDRAAFRDEASLQGLIRRRNALREELQQLEAKERDINRERLLQQNLLPTNDLAAEKLDELDGRLNDILEARNQKQRELLLLNRRISSEMVKQEEIAELQAEHLGDVRRIRAEIAARDAQQAEQRRQREQAEQLRQMRAEGRARAGELGAAIQHELNPRAARAREIIQQAERRRAEIRHLQRIGSLNTQEATELDQAARRSAWKQLRALDNEARRERQQRGLAGFMPPAALAANTALDLRSSEGAAAVLATLRSGLPADPKKQDSKKLDDIKANTSSTAEEAQRTREAIERRFPPIVVRAFGGT